MASKITIDATIDDKGTMGRLTLMAKKLGGAFNKVTGSVANTDRAWKGASKQSSSTTKNFSKMAQGMSGTLIPAYAVLAANIFAVSAAFNFLKSAGQLKQLQEGQTIYAAATGIALRSLTNDIIAATDAQITFADASQAAAIGVASGLNPEQLTKLGKAARDASLILGRDVTDSFNRLVRGVTKAEPELLDELGIILRLKDATEAYGLAIGKSAEDLSAFERTQAVANDVLTQSEEKYGRILAILSPEANTFNQLGKAFDDLLNKVKWLASTLLGPVAEALTRFPVAGIAILGLFSKGILSSILNTESWGIKSAEAAAYAENGYRKAKIALDALNVSQNKGLLKARTTAAKNLQNAPATGFTGAAFKLAASGKGDQLTGRQIGGMKSAIRNHKTMTDVMKAQYIAALTQMSAANKSFNASTSASVQVMASTWQVGFAKIKMAAASTFAFIKGGIASTVTFGTKMLGWLGYIGIAITVVTTAWAAFTDATKKPQDELSATTERMASLTEEYEKFNRVQAEVVRGGDNALIFYEALGKRLASVGIEAQSAVLSKSVEEFNSDEDLSILQKLQNFANVIGDDPHKTYDSFGEFLFGSVDDATKDLGKYYKDIQKASGVDTVFGEGGSTAAATFFNKLNRLFAADKSNLKVRIEEMLAAQSGLIEVGANITELRKLQTANQADAGSIMAGFLPESKEARAVISLNRELILIEGAKKDATVAGTKVLNDQIDTIKTQISLFTRMKSLDEDRIRNAAKLKLAGVVDGTATTTGQQFFLNLKREEQALLDRKVFAMGELQMLLEQTPTDKRTNAITRQQEELALINAQNIALQRKLSITAQLEDNAKQSFETGAIKGLADLIKNNEGSLKDAMRTIAISMLESTADVLAKNIVGMMMAKMTFTTAVSTATTQAGIISKSFIAAGEVVAARISAALIGTPGVQRAFTNGKNGLPNMSIHKGPREGGLMGAVKGFGSMLLSSMPAVLGVPGMATGGIVDSAKTGSLTMTHGKEAVIPLANGAVPVDLKGSGAQNQININIDASGSSSSNGGGGDMDQLGKAVAGAVQRELQNQKRAGGILSPYGAS